MKKYRALLVKVLPSVSIMAILLCIKPPWDNMTFGTYVMIIIPFSIFIGMLISAAFELKDEDSKILEELKLHLGNVDGIERFGVAISQPLRGVYLNMPISDTEKGLYQVGYLEGKQLHNARSNFEDFTSGYNCHNYTELMQFITTCLRRITGEPDTMAFNCCYFTHHIICGVETSQLSHKEGMSLLMPIERILLENYSSWVEYECQLRKTLRNSKWYRNWGFRMQLSDLRKKVISPWNLTPWNVAKPVLIPTIIDDNEPLV